MTWDKGCSPCREAPVAEGFRTACLGVPAVVNELNFHMDTLTGLPNRNAYYRAARKMDENIAAGEAPEFTMVMLDVNNLKVVNDEQGHDAGDELLRKAARQMNDAFGGHPVYRIGGDEFVVLIGDAVADACFAVEGEVSIACGSATYRQGEDACVADVLARADTAMYECKRRMKQQP